MVRALTAYLKIRKSSSSSFSSSSSPSEHERPGHATLEGDDMTCLALLLRRGADLEAKNHTQQTLLKCIEKKYGETKTDKLLKESGNEWGVKE